MKVYAIILAAGIGQRFSNDTPKQFIKIAGKTILEHTLKTFDEHEKIDSLIVVTNPNYRIFTEELIMKNGFKKVEKVINGGNTRQESTELGISVIKDEDSIVLVHDAVRPFVSKKIISDVILKLNEYDAVDVCVKSPDTIVKFYGDRVVDIPNRNELLLGQTPQGFKFWILKKAYELYRTRPIEVTDDCSLILKYNLGKVGIVFGERFNIKITYPEDIYFADKIFQVKTFRMYYENKNYFRDLKDKVFVIFGGKRGIGRRISEIASDFGAKVYSFSRKNNVNIKSPINVRRALSSVWEKEGRIDFIVNTAAILNMGLLENREYPSIFDEINTNYLGNIIIIKEGIKYLEKSKGAFLLFSSSSYTRGRALYSVYSSTKAAVVNLMQAMSEELISKNIKINVINPERTNTEMRRENFGKEDPKTLLDPDKVAWISIKTLLSDITGQVIDVRIDDEENDIKSF